MIIATESHLFSCFCIKAEGGIGTAFVFQSKSGSFFVTAQHVLGGASVGSYIYVKKPNEWCKFEIIAIYAHPEKYDIAMFKLALLNPVVSHLFGHPHDPKISLGEELKFLGFPHGLENTAASKLGFSTPLLKTAFFSGMIVESASGRSWLILDGLNNPGYSGAPIWTRGAHDARPALLGVISGYRVEDRSKSRVYEAHQDGRELATPNLFVKPNSGIIHAVAYSELLRLVAAADMLDC